MNYTRGPWDYFPADYFGATSTKGWPTIRTPDAKVQIAIVGGSALACPPRDSRGGNGRLLAAAPDLYAELSLIFDQWPEFEKDEEVNGGDLVEFMAERWPHIKAAVEKARGKS